ncbi:MAG: GXGXG motif-containing protein [Gammaproteobacteria bacterium]|jgi:glutamate synthase domain-containing protein 3|nr:GXGXG motif-containing protein [Gammaproteobacteria bacterium]|tara:strand:- start:490 stop:1332 length:843 start_codon:yes stop_codon:yes gene_type:complete
MATLTKDKSHEMGLHEEALLGRTQQRFFSAEESENFTYYHSFDVDIKKSASIDAQELTPREINRQIRELMQQGVGDITIDNPMSRHGVGVGILNRVNLTFTDSLGYFGCGLIDGPNIHIKGRVGWSCGENMMAGTVVIDSNAGSTFGAAIRGGDLVCRGSVGARTGIDQKGGTIIVGGDTGAFSGFMMQRGRMIVCGDAGMNLGDSMYDGTIYVGGEVEELGVDCVPGEMTELDIRYLSSKLDLYGIKTPNGVEKMNKYVSGKQLWNYDKLEPHEKKLVL